MEKEVKPLPPYPFPDKEAATLDLKNRLLRSVEHPRRLNLLPVKLR